MEYNARMTVLRDKTSSNIAFNYALANATTNSPPCLAVCSSLAIRSFSAIRKRTLELVASTYYLVASASAAKCLCTLDTITHSSNYARDVWSSGVDTLRDCTTLCWDSSNEMSYIPPFGWSPKISVYPWSLRTFSSLDVVKLVGRPLGVEAWGRCLALTPIAPYIYPSVQVLYLSPERSPAPTMVHPVYLMPVVLMSLLPIEV